MSFQKSHIVTETLKEVISEFELEFGETISVDEAFKIVANQFNLISIVMEEGKDIVLPHFGKFIDNTDARTKAKEDFKHGSYGKLSDIALNGRIELLM